MLSAVGAWALPAARPQPDGTRENGGEGGAVAVAPKLAKQTAGGSVAELRAPAEAMEDADDAIGDAESGKAPRGRPDPKFRAAMSLILQLEPEVRELDCISVDTVTS